jgi:hypothetical protein
MTFDQHTERGTVMTVHTAHPHHISARTATLALAGGLLAATAGYGVATLVLDEASAPAPAQPTDVTGNPHPPTGLFPGTDKEERALMHRR